MYAVPVLPARRVTTASGSESTCIAGVLTTSRRVPSMTNHVHWSSRVANACTKTPSPSSAPRTSASSAGMRSSAFARVLVGNSGRIFLRRPTRESSLKRCRSSRRQARSMSCSCTSACTAASRNKRRSGALRPLGFASKSSIAGMSLVRSSGARSTAAVATASSKAVRHDASDLRASADDLATPA